MRRKYVTIERDKKGEPEARRLHISRAVTGPIRHPHREGTQNPGGASATSRSHRISCPSCSTHLDKWAEHGDNGLPFPAVESPGHHMKHGALYKVYRRARKATGGSDLCWHDLRHTGATLAAQQGSTLAELMNLLGHSTVDGAMIYQHAGAERDREIARRLSALVTGTSG